jgi:hypothetical protein
VLKKDLAALGPLKTLPYLVMFLMSNVGGWAGDWLILSRKQSVATARKTVNSIGEWRVSTSPHQGGWVVGAQLYAMGVTCVCIAESTARVCFAALR